MRSYDVLLSEILDIGFSSISIAHNVDETAQVAPLEAGESIMVDISFHV